VISVDGKKKELVGKFSNGGQDYRPVGEPVQTNIYDFNGELGKVTPYGVYGMAANAGWSRWGPTTTPASSRSSRSAAGGTRSGVSPTPLPTGC
jgi:hypothetical protein